jgi:hypothetical protein
MSGDGSERSPGDEPSWEVMLLTLSDLCADRQQVEAELSRLD